MDGVHVVCVSFSWVRLDPKLGRVPVCTACSESSDTFLSAGYFLSRDGHVLRMAHHPDGERNRLTLFYTLVP